MKYVQEVYAILLAKGYQEQFFQDLPGKSQKQKRGLETLVDCRFLKKVGHFT